MEKVLEREKIALKETSPGDAVTDHTGDDTPRPTADQLVGNECVRFQALRVGFFTLDIDATLACLDEGADTAPGSRPGDRIVFNRIVSLKEDAGKKAT